MRFLSGTLAASVAVAALASSSPADASLSALYSGWGSGPASLLFTNADEAEWSAIATDASAEKFVRLFWLRRDPTPGTPDNEFRRDFERRVALSMQSFGEELEGVVTPGWKTDRGRTFILLGPPKRRQKSGSTGDASGGDTGVSAGSSGSVTSGAGAGLFGTGGNQDRFGGASGETWIYEDDGKPAWIKKKRVTVKFRSQPGKPIVSLDNSEEALALMAEARKHALVAPELDERALASAPAAGGIAGGLRLFAAKAVTDATLAEAWKSAPVTPAVAGTLAAGAFQASDASWLVSVQVALPAAPPAGTRAIVELSREDGTSLVAFEPSQPWKSGPGQSFVQASVAPPAGTYDVRAAVRDASGAFLWAGSEKVVVPEALEGFWVSEILLSEQIAPMEKAQDPLQPFAWQGIAVLPNASGTFPQGGLLWIYLHACQPALDAAGKPQYQAKVELSGAADFRGAVRGEPVKASDACWVVAQAFDLTPGAFPVGDYRIDVEIQSGDAPAVKRTARFRVNAAGG